MTTRKQVVDVQIRLNIQEEQVYEGHCSQCNNVLTGKFSKEFINPVQYGTGLKAIIAMLLNEGMVSIARTGNLISELTNQEINLSEGTIVNIQNELSKKSEPLVEKLKEGNYSGARGSILKADNTIQHHM